MGKRTIIVPVDFSVQSRAALVVAESFAKEQDCELLIVHVIEDDFEVYFPLGGVSKEDATTGLYNALHEVKPKDDSVVFSHRLLDGEPALAILDLAKEVDAEMIVMGTHGRSGLKRMIMGSVAEEVVRKAQCPVLTLRNTLDSYEKEPMGIA